MKKMLYLLLWCYLFSPPLKAQQWAQMGADIDGEYAGQFSGYSVALAGNSIRVAIGAAYDDDNGSNAGHVRVYDWDGSSWVQVGADIDGQSGGDYSGSAVAISENGLRVAIGSPFNGSGHVQVYEWNGTTWVQVGANIIGETSGDQSGRAIDISDDGLRVAIGAELNDGTAFNAGHARVYEWNGAAWVQLGADIDGEAGSDRFGRDVAIAGDGTRLIVSSVSNSGNGASAGHARVYEWNGAAWVQLGIDIDGQLAGDLLGFSVAISDDGLRVAIGAAGGDANGSDAGYSQIHEWNGAAWVQLGVNIDGEAANDYSGYEIALSADGLRVAIGGYYNDNSNGIDAGHIRVYDWNGSAWVQNGSDIDGEGASDFFSNTFAFSNDGSRLAAGASYNNGNGNNAGHTRIFEAPINLPIELLSFDVTRINADKVKLAWVTASETNNKGFEVERMYENQTTFEAITWLEAQGTTKRQKNYDFLDKNSYIGVTYYRLKQVDEDGAITYSNIKAVIGANHQNTDYMDVSVYPNPVQDELKIRFNELPKDVQTATIQIVGANGQVLHHFIAGVASYQVLEIEYIKQLPPAMYLLSIEMNNSEKILQEFIKE